MKGSPCPWLDIYTKKLMKSFEKHWEKLENINLMKTGNHIRPWETNVIKRLSKQNQTTKNHFTWRYTPKSLRKTTKTFRLPYISVLFVQKELKLLSRQKSTRIDNLPPWLLKDCGSIISKPLCHIINLSIRSRKFPLSWKVANVTSIFKYGSPSLPEN